MPYLIFISKFGVSIAYLTSYFASFTDNRIFPIEKRATAVGICKLVGRTFAALAPMVNEYSKPIPMESFVVMLAISFLYNISLSLPDIEEK
jgi:hypothetical protein